MLTTGFLNRQGCRGLLRELTGCKFDLRSLSVTNGHSLQTDPTGAGVWFIQHGPNNTPPPDRHG
ncbi:MAG: hypothetical protein AAFQ57_04835 [Cyanobacteria bacterium J06626_14]